MYRFVTFLFIFLALLGCANQKAEQAVRLALVDPDSAKFGKTILSKDDSVACGHVNSKNRMGGYAGDQSFMVIDGVVWLPDGINDEVAIAECCTSMLTKRNGRELNELMLSLQESCMKLTPRTPSK